MIAWDIETGPLPTHILAELCPPFEPPPHPGEFNPSLVKLGNLKDEAKRAAKIKESHAAHAAAVESYSADIARAKDEHFAKFCERAALDPTTGQVLAIGFLAMDNNRKIVIDTIDDDPNCEAGSEEFLLLNSFWSRYVKFRNAGRKMIGCNILNFDLPFLVRRSWILGVDIPSTFRNGRYFDPLFCDIRDAWLCGQRWSDCESSLNAIARALGCGEKNGSGADFASLYTADREAAMVYLRNDLELTAACAARMGV